MNKVNIEYKIKIINIEGAPIIKTTRFLLGISTNPWNMGRLFNHFRN